MKAKPLLRLSKSVLRILNWQYTNKVQFLFLALLLICSSCATQNAVEQTRRMEASGNYEEAYSNIVLGLKSHPQNQTLLAEKTRIGELFADDLLKKEAALPTNNLVQRIHLLEEASSLDSSKHTVITAELENLQSQRSDILKRVENLTNDTDINVLVGRAEPLLAYKDSDPQIKEKLVDSPAVLEYVTSVFKRFSESNDLHVARNLIKRCENIWGKSNFEPMAMEIDVRLRTSGIQSIEPPPIADASLGNKTVYHLLPVLFNPGDVNAIERFANLRRQLVRQGLPDAKILILGALSKDQIQYFQSKIFSTNGDGALPFLNAKTTNFPAFLINFNVTDSAFKLNMEDNVVYSKY